MLLGRIQLDVKTRWNSTYRILEQAILLRNADVGICNVNDDLADFGLQESDWSYLGQLPSLLKKFDILPTKGISKLIICNISFDNYCWLAVLVESAHCHCFWVSRERRYCLENENSKGRVKNG